MKIAGVSEESRISVKQQVEQLGSPEGLKEGLTMVATVSTDGDFETRSIVKADQLNADGKDLLKYWGQETAELTISVKKGDDGKEKVEVRLEVSVTKEKLAEKIQQVKTATGITDDMKAIERVLADGKVPEKMLGLSLIHI